MTKSDDPTSDAAPQGAIWLETSAGKLLFVEGSSIARAVEKRRIHDPGVEFFMRKYSAGLFPFFDVGANVGLFSIVATRTAPTGDVIAFEPDRKNLELLKLNLASAGADRVRVMPIAVGRADGTIRLGSVDCGLSKKSSVEAVEVPCRSLQSYIGEANITPSFLKIDIEGAELEVLEGLASSPALQTVIIELEFSWRDHHRHINRFLELCPTERVDFEFLLSASEEETLQETGCRTWRKQVTDQRTGRRMTSILARDGGQLGVVFDILERSTAQQSSRKWELCITPKDRTLMSTSAAAAGHFSLN